jgi:hypothetical protein
VDFKPEVIQIQPAHAISFFRYFAKMNYASYFLYFDSLPSKYLRTRAIRWGMKWSEHVWKRTFVAICIRHVTYSLYIFVNFARTMCSNYSIKKVNRYPIFYQHAAKALYSLPKRYNKIRRLINTARPHIKGCYPIFTLSREMQGGRSRPSDCCLKEKENGD